MNTKNKKTTEKKSIEKKITEEKSTDEQVNEQPTEQNNVNDTDVRNQLEKKFNNIIKIYESLITDSVSVENNKNNFVSLTNIFNKFNIFMSFNNRIIENISNIKYCNDKIKDENEVNIVDDEFNKYYIMKPCKSHSFAIQNNDVIDAKINMIYDLSNKFIKLCYELLHINNGVCGKKIRLNIQSINNMILEYNNELKVEVPYILKTSKISKKVKSSDESVQPEIPEIKHKVISRQFTKNIKKSDIDKYQLNNPNDSDESSNSALSKKSKSSKKKLTASSDSNSEDTENDEILNNEESDSDRNDE
jgi:hypothetical protein